MAFHFLMFGYLIVATSVLQFAMFGGLVLIAKQLAKLFRISLNRATTNVLKAIAFTMLMFVSGGGALVLLSPFLEVLAKFSN